MRILLRIIIIAIWILTITIDLKAQDTTIIIILRHAEKETTTPGSQMMHSDPSLSKVGRTRAENLVMALKEFTPDHIYSTRFNRTMSTVAPLAKKYNLYIQAYDANRQPAFADSLKEMAGKTIVVVGHSNTAPRLVNHILGAGSQLPDLDDSVYDQLYIIKIIAGVPALELRLY